MVSKVTQPGSPEHRVRDGVQQDICVRAPDESGVMVHGSRDLEIARIARHRRHGVAEGQHQGGIVIRGEIRLLSAEMGLEQKVAIEGLGRLDGGQAGALQHLLHQPLGHPGRGIGHRQEGGGGAVPVGGAQPPGHQLGGHAGTGAVVHQNQLPGGGAHPVAQRVLAPATAGYADSP